MHTLDEFFELLPGAKNYGNYVAGICPFHKDRHPSLFVYKDDFFRCVADECHVMGNHEKLWRKLKNSSGTVYIPEGPNIKPPWISLDEIGEVAASAHSALNTYEFRKGYLTNRGLCDMIDKGMLGWYEGWYTIPVFDEEGEVSGLVLRAGPDMQERSGMRFSQPFGSKPQPFIPDRELLTGFKPLVVVFGMFDALALAELGYPAITTTGGETTFDPNWLDEWRLPVLIIPDKGGERVAYDVGRELGWRAEIVFLPYPDKCKDPADMIANGHIAQLKEALDAR